MLFIHPMWDSETERLGKKACTPTGYALHGLADTVVLSISSAVRAWRDGLRGGFGLAYGTVFADRADFW
jgi:hypothetical protein